MKKIEISLVRKGSMGLKGTYIRSRHHARILLPFIESMRGAVKHLGFVKWIEGETVHEFRTEDGRRFTLRGVTIPEEDITKRYVGVKLSLRLSRTVEYPLIVVKDISEMPSLLQAMRLMAVPHEAEAEVDLEEA